MSPDGWLSEAIAYIGMMSILLAFLLETRDVLHSKQPVYLFMMAFGSGLLGIRAFLISEWAFLVLEVVWCAAAVMEGEVASEVNLQGPLALVVGSEGDGVRRTVAEACDYLIRVPMSVNFDSLNASVAGGILMYEALRQRM